MERVGDFTLTWGESLRWDERTNRLWFADCAAQTLHWLDGGEPPCAVLLDEPTRGMDRAVKGELADRLRAFDAAVIVATHDAEFAVAVADRVVLLADGRPVADASAEEVLTGGWYFATETARIVGALTPEQGAERIRRDMSMEVPTP